MSKIELAILCAFLVAILAFIYNANVGLPFTNQRECIKLMPYVDNVSQGQGQRYYYDSNIGRCCESFGYFSGYGTYCIKLSELKEVANIRK